MDPVIGDQSCLLRMFVQEEHTENVDLYPCLM